MDRVNKRSNSGDHGSRGSRGSPRSQNMREKVDTHYGEKPVPGETGFDQVVEAPFNVTGDDLQEAKALADNMSLTELRTVLRDVHEMHAHDPNFPATMLEKIRDFLDNENVWENPDAHDELIYEMKVESALITNNSPYAEVRAVVDNHDDANTPCGTLRAWCIGLSFTVFGGLINQLFSIRQPSIGVGSNVAQLLAYPIGKACERFLPDVGFTLQGVRYSLNPGPFSIKEHMLITIMANVGFSTPYTNNIIWIQYLPRFFNQSYAGQFSYQIMIAFSTNFIGYGMAGMIRRFLVYPSYCVWPTSLVTIALNKALHTTENVAVEGPFRRIYRASRYKFFMIAFFAMFVYFWIPDYFFNAMSYFSWITWLAPDNININAISGFQNGLGVNPFPTFDWNILATDPLMVPFFSTINQFVGVIASFFVVVALWYTNTFHTGYLPINSNHIYDNTGKLYNVSRAVDKHALFDAAKYESYSPAYLGAGFITIYVFFFAIYSAILTYVILYHRKEVGKGFKNLFLSFRNKNHDAGYRDVHNRLMAKYPEVPEWWYLIVLAAAITTGLIGITAWQTYTSPVVVFYGLVLCIIFVVPIGVVTAMTGLEVTLNVLAEFIGGAWQPGNALAMNYFKCYGYVTCAHALTFASDLKLAHYTKIPPRQTFFAQIIATFVSTLVCVGILNFQMNGIPEVCTVNAPNHFTCPGINTFFAASVLWGTIGPKKIFGVGGQYSSLMIGWPLGVVIVLGVWLLQRSLKKSRWARQMHPIAMISGCLIWAPYNMSYVIPAVPIAWLSWIWCKNRYLGFWSKYNYVLSASWSSSIAIAGIIIFFTVQWTNLDIDWWGNNVVYQGCEGQACTLYELGPGEHFGPGPGEFH